MDFFGFFNACSNVVQAPAGVRNKICETEFRCVKQCECLVKGISHFKDVIGNL
jgi:hypothetical protein